MEQIVEEQEQNQKKKNILFLVLTLGIGGAERQTEDLVNGLNNNEFNMSVLYFLQFDIANVNINQNNLQMLKHVERSGKFDFSAIHKIKEYIVENNIDTVFCVEEFAFLIGFLVKKSCPRKFKLITCLHHTKPFPGIWEKIKDKFYHFLLNSNDKLVFVSQNQMNYWVSENAINPEISTVIHNGIDVDYFSFEQVEKSYPDARIKLRAELGIANDHFVVGINAFLREGKRHTDLIDAIKLCHQQGYPKISACIIGRGSQQELIEDHIKQHNMQSFIKLVGFQKDVRPYIQLCDCMCLPSDSEAFSMASLESMALGKPVIMSDVGGANEQVIEGVNGYLFQPRDVNQFAALIIKLINNSETQTSENTRESVCNRFSLDVMLVKYQKLFHSLS